MMDRRSFLFGLPLMPWLVKPLRLVGLPVMHKLTVSLMIKRPGDADYSNVESVWDVHLDRAGKYCRIGRIRACKINGESVAPYMWYETAMSMPTVRDGQLGIAMVGQGSVTDNALFLGRDDEFTAADYERLR